MNLADEVIQSMVYPGNERPFIWHGGILQIWVTRACDQACFGCTQGSNLRGKPGMITLEQFEQAVSSLRNYFGVVGMFGGNPAIHPQFEELCAIMKKYIPFERRGLWCNHPRGKGAICRDTFNPEVSNLNVHMDQEAWDEFVRDWPESEPRLKGLDEDALHTPPFAALIDHYPDENQRWEKIRGCDINRNWSAMVCVVRGKVRGYFCEIAGAQAMLHADNPDWPDLGVEVTDDWWRKGHEAFAEQVRWHCHRCGIPMREDPVKAIGDTHEKCSPTHAAIYRPKVKDRPVLVLDEVHEAERYATQYLSTEAAR